MSRNKEIDQLLGTVSFDRKSVDFQLKDILSNICFAILSEISTFIYSNKVKEAEYNSYCGTIFKRIEDSIKEAHKSKSYEDYVENIEECVIYVQGLSDKLTDKYDFIREVEEVPELLLEFREVHVKVYNKFFIKKRKGKVKKNESKKR